MLIRSLQIVLLSMKETKMNNNIVPLSQISNNGYFAVVLDKNSQKEMKLNATFDVVNGDHITLAYKPDNKKFVKLAPLVNKKVDAFVNQIRGNESIEAYWVKEMYLKDTYQKLKRLDKGPAHITISHKKNFKPGDANSMFKKPTYKENIPEQLQVSGKVKWIQYK